jgi:hypothetical protein
MGPAIVIDPRDAVEHKHRRKRQLRIPRSKKLTAPTGQQLVVIVRMGAFCHGLPANLEKTV